MAYDAQTLQLFHELTEEGTSEYRRMLELEGDRIIFRHRHPLRYAFSMLCDIISEAFDNKRQGITA